MNSAVRTPFMLKTHAIVFCLSLLMLTACGNKKQNQEKTKPKIEISAFKLESKEGYGYEIKVNGGFTIRQEYIPAVEGMIPFKTEKDALKVADMVKEKIEKNQSPTLTKEEIEKKLGTKF